MKFLILALVLAVAQARPQADVPIVKSEYEIEADGNFHYGYETGNGIAAEAQGGLKQQNSGSLEIKGSSSYTSPEGEQVSISYVADENGYQPSGSHIPQAPPVPDYILRSLEYIAAHPPPAAPPSVVAARLLG